MKQNLRKDRKVKGTAYHEAGHAVAAFAFGKTVHSVTIVSNDETLGLTRYSRIIPIPEFPEGVRDRLRVEREIMCGLAGDIAEAYFFNESLDVRKHGAHMDYEQALDVAATLIPSHPERQAFVNWLFERTKSIICGKVYWPAVCRIAEALLTEKTISGRKARQIALEATGVKFLRV